MRNTIAPEQLTMLSVLTQYWLDTTDFEAILFPLRDSIITWVKQMPWWIIHVIIANKKVQMLVQIVLDEAGGNIMGHQVLLPSRS